MDTATNGDTKNRSSIYLVTFFSFFSPVPITIFFTNRVIGLTKGSRITLTATLKMVWALAICGVSDGEVEEIKSANDWIKGRKRITPARHGDWYRYLGFQMCEGS